MSAAAYFIDDHGDISVFMTVQDAESCLEAIDVRNQEYVGYDSLGRLLHLSAIGDAVQISLAENQPTHSSELADKLRIFLAQVHDSAEEDSSCDLAGLVLRFQKFAYNRPRSFWQFLTGKRK